MEPTTSGGKFGWSPWDLTLVILCVTFIAALVGVIVVSIYRSFTLLESLLFDVLVLGLGLAASYRFGRFATQDAAREMAKQHARPSFRRVLTLYNSLHQLSARIESFNQTAADDRFDVIQAVVEEQIAGIGAAIEDWRDIVPEDVDEIVARNESRLRKHEHGTSA